MSENKYYTTNWNLRTESGEAKKNETSVNFTKHLKIKEENLPNLENRRNEKNLPWNISMKRGYYNSSSLTRRMMD